MSSRCLTFDIARFKPNSQDCLAWSADGELAVAGGESVAILGQAPSGQADPSLTSLSKEILYRYAMPR